MKKIITIMVLILALPSLTAHASSGRCTFKSFVIANWKGEVESADEDAQGIEPDETDPAVDDRNDVPEETTSPVDELPPDPTTDETEQSEEPVVIEFSAAEGEEEITINTEDSSENTSEEDEM